MMKKLICLALLAMAPWGMGEEDVELEMVDSNGMEYSGEDMDPNVLRATDSYFSEMRAVKANYRKRFAEVLRMAEKVEVFLVDFDGSVPLDKLAEDRFGEVVDQEYHLGKVSDYVELYSREGYYTKILKRTELEENDRKKLLMVLGEGMSKVELSVGPMCHFPIHGIRVHRAGKVIYETTFCWQCSNYGFYYPIRDSAWLGTTEEMEELFKKLMPIPQSEIDRFEKKYPSEKK